jgi:hypothetical protein
VPGWLRGPLHAVLRDLGARGLAVGWTETGWGSGGTVWLQEPGDALGLMGVHVARGGFGEVAVALADGLQDELVESRGGWGEARPACPGHGHPAAAGLEGRSAWWWCPVTGRRLRRIGKA